MQCSSSIEKIPATVSSDPPCLFDDTIKSPDSVTLMKTGAIKAIGSAVSIKKIFVSTDGCGFQSPKVMIDILIKKCDCCRIPVMMSESAKPIQEPTNVI
jgi:hypothetical protein